LTTISWVFVCRNEIPEQEFFVHSLSFRSGAVATALLVAACSDSGEDLTVVPNDGVNVGGTATVGTPGVGGTSSSNPPAPTGGKSSQIRTSTGGSLATGGKTNGMGGNGAGGRLPTGGANPQGGTVSTGGASNPSGASGGKIGSGGGITGGKASTGGESSTGGAATGGGKASSGGAAAGGKASTGGAATGGQAAGGTAGAPSTDKWGKKFVGNITTGYNNGIDSNGLTYSKYWDQISPENAGKWGSVQSNAGSSFNWSGLDAIYNYTKTNNIIFKEHCFIWGAQQPGGTVNETTVKNWMTEFCKRYPDVKVIDVVNEPPPHTTPSYANSIGGGTNGDWKWITNAFTWARAACPNAILVLNDYNDIEWSGDNAHIIDIVKKIKAAGAPIDAIGAQAHDLDHSSVSLSTVKSLLAKLNSDTGLPIYITEMDIDRSDDAQQLSLYQQYFPLFMQAEYVKGITIWGWIYGSTWGQAPSSGLIRNGQPRTAMTWLMQQLNRPSP
jgi:endo-1,4-beta-xylanase